MKRTYLIVGSLSFLHFFSNAQVLKDTASTVVNKTDIEIVYSHYLQDGNNSAVTGGIGTEKLIVYGPALHLKNTSGKNSVSFNIGADIISSASTDNIDFVVSSASKEDIRTYLNGSYSKKFEKQHLHIHGGSGFSIESDYFSVLGSLGLIKKDKNELRSFSVQFQFFNDDLRWGRINAGHYKPVGLIYPQELRYREWYDTYDRYSYILKLGFTQVLNRRNTLGLFPELTYQQGLLATPFHRVYFADNKLAVENLPGERWKGSVALKLNTFFDGTVIFKNAIQGYMDNFGILALSFENETAIKITPSLTLLHLVRIYSQKKSDYFSPYKEHKISDKFYTSDYDLSSFQTYCAGVGVKYSPQSYLRKRFIFNAIIFRYNYQFRTNNLNAHIFSLIIQTSVLGRK